MSLRNQLRRSLFALPMLGLLIAAPFAPEPDLPLPRLDPNVELVRVLPKTCLNLPPHAPRLAG